MRASVSERMAAGLSELMAGEQPEHVRAGLIKLMTPYFSQSWNA